MNIDGHNGRPIDSSSSLHCPILPIHHIPCLSSSRRVVYEERVNECEWGFNVYWPRKDENEEEGSNQASDTEQVHNRSWLLLCRKTSERRGPSLSKSYKIRLPHLDSSSTLLSCPSPGPPSLLFRTGRTRVGTILLLFVSRVCMFLSSSSPQSRTLL